MDTGGIVRKCLSFLLLATLLVQSIIVLADKGYADCHAFSQQSTTIQTPVMMECLKQIEEQARLFYRRQDEFHNERHGKRVVAFAQAINIVEQADPFLVEAGAWLHQFHDHLDELETLLKKTGLNSDQQKQLYEIVRLCRPRLIHPEAPLAARVVFDADALDLMGAYGVVRELSCNIRVRGMDGQQAVTETRKVQVLFAKKLMTVTGKAMAQERQKTTAAFWQAYDHDLIFPETPLLKTYENL